MAEQARAPKKSSTKAKTLASIKSLDAEDDERTTVSKKISWILRHGAPKGYMENSNGWVKVEDLLKAEILEGISRETLDKVIIDSNQNKLRYQLSSDGQKIKAYSKAERKNLSDTNQEPQPDQASLRAEALEFVPGNSVAAAVAAEATAAKMTDYSWPHLGLNPFMQFPYGWPGSSPMAGRLPSMAPPRAQAAGRHVGKIKSYNATKGFGFVECPEVFAQYKRDVFIHKAQIGDMKVGDNVIFTVETNKQGMPQAKELTTIMGVPVAAGGAPVGDKGMKGGKDNGKGTGKGKGSKGEGKSKGAGKAKPGEQVKDEAESKPKAEETGDSKAEEPEGS